MLTSRGWPAALADGLAMGSNLITEFLYQRFVVFGKSIDTAVKAPEDGDSATEEGKNDEDTGIDNSVLP